MTLVAPPSSVAIAILVLVATVAASVFAVARFAPAIPRRCPLSEASATPAFQCRGAP